MWWLCVTNATTKRDIIKSITTGIITRGTITIIITITRAESELSKRVEGFPV
jgi:hypothetical protein